MAHRGGRYEERERHERQNEYFIEKDGISREVIQADICRYLGNDALVRPGAFQGRQGYFIRGYRNLTSEMIADLKADSARWEADVARRESQGYPKANYDTSSIHEKRQQVGPSPSYNSAPERPPYADTYASPPNPYGSAPPNPQYVSSEPPGYPSQPAYGSGPSPYPSGTPPAVSSAEMHGSYPYSGAPYQYESRSGGAGGYSGPVYENDPDYPVGSSGMRYPPATSAPDHRMMDPRYSGEQAYPDHRSQPSRTQPPRDRDPHRRAR